MKRLLCIIMVSLLAVGASAAKHSISDIPDVQKADSTRFVSNPDHILSDQDVATLDSILLDIRRTTTCQMAIVVIDKPESEDVEEFATDLFNKWGIGAASNDNGILIFVSMDPRDVTIRTGDGTEGVLPDILCGRILDDYVIPDFKEGNYGAGLIAGAREIRRIVTDPDVRDELVADAEAQKKAEVRRNISIYIGAVFVSLLLFILLMWMFTRPKNGKPLNDYEKYHALSPLLIASILGSILCVGAPLLSVLAIWLYRRHLRNRKHKCAKCHADMVKLDEQADNAYLTPAQDTEEKIGSVDYDVWLCPQCGNTEIYRFANTTRHSKCEFCNAMTATLIAESILENPTTRTYGKGIKTYRCEHCGKQFQQPFTIERLTSGGGGGFGGSGSGGGGWGGGTSSGGGASRSW